MVTTKKFIYIAYVFRFSDYKMAEDSKGTEERQILSNVGQVRLEEMLAQAEGIRERIDGGTWGGYYNADLYPFLDPSKDLVLIDRNPEYLKEISDRMFGVLMPDRKPMMMIKAMFPHHMVDYGLSKSEGK